MGLLDLFGKKSKEDEAAAREAMKAILQHQAESRKDAVDSDEIPTGYGPFGLCKTNPVPTQGVPESNKYISRLKTKDGRSVQCTRVGSTSAKDVTSGMIDMYSISCAGTDVGKLYLCPYHKRNSAKAPEGFKLV